MKNTMNTTKKEVKVGLIGVGLNTYWNQFEGLLSRLTDYQRMIKERMSGLQATVIDGGMVDSPEKAARTAEVLKSEDIEIKKGEVIGQAIFQKYLVSDDDSAEGERLGGFGSTNK